MGKASYNDLVLPNELELVDMKDASKVGSMSISVSVRESEEDDSNEEIRGGVDVPVADDGWIRTRILPSSDRDASKEMSRPPSCPRRLAFDSSGVSLKASFCTVEVCV
jgi:hypothetical protein